MRLLRSGSCSRKERAVTWNAQGVVGAAGPAGPAGPAGAQGPAGGVSGYQTVVQTFTDVVLDVSSPSAFRQVTCPAGTKVLSGGYVIRGNDGVSVDIDAPVADRGWQVRIVLQESVSTSTISFDVHAVCATAG